MKKLLCALSVICFSVAACGSGGPAAAGPMTQAPAKHGGSGIELRYAVPASLKPGEVGVVRLQLDGVRADDAQVELRGDNPSVQIRIAGQPIAGAIRLERGRTRTIDLEVSAPDGLQYVNVFASQDGRFSAYSIPLSVGSGTASLKANGVTTTTPAGERIISLPSK